MIMFFYKASKQIKHCLLSIFLLGMGICIVNAQDTNRQGKFKRYFISINAGYGEPITNHVYSTYPFPDGNNFALKGYDINIYFGRHIGRSRYLALFGNIGYSNNPFDASSYVLNLLEAQYVNPTNEFVQLLSNNYKNGNYQVVSFSPGLEITIPIHKFELDACGSFGLAVDFSPAVFYNATFQAMKPVTIISFGHIWSYGKIVDESQSMNVKSQKSESVIFEVSLGLRYNVISNFYITINPGIMFTNINFPVLQGGTNPNNTNQTSTLTSFELLELSGGIGYKF